MLSGLSDGEDNDPVSPRSRNQPTFTYQVPDPGSSGFGFFEIVTPTRVFQLRAVNHDVMHR